KPLALALRSTIYRPNDIVDLVRVAEKAGVDTIFFPDVPQGFDSLGLCAFAFAATESIKIGTGVVRPLEHSSKNLVRSIQTLQFLSNGRFILGAGTGNPGQN